MGMSKFWEIVKDREAWRAAVHDVIKSQTRLSNWKTTMCIFVCVYIYMYMYVYMYAYPVCVICIYVYPICVMSSC